MAKTWIQWDLIDSGEQTGKESLKGVGRIISAIVDVWGIVFIYIKKI